MKKYANEVNLIILNYNSADRTIEMIKQASQLDSISHIVVVDNNSSDDSAYVLMKFKHANYTFLASDFNGGYGYGNNIGLEFIRNNFKEKYVVISNPDVTFTNATINYLVDSMKSDLNVLISAPLVTEHGFARASTEMSNIQLVLDSSIILNRYLKNILGYKKSSYFKKVNEFDSFLFPGSCFLVDVEKFDEIGNFDQSIFLYGEEISVAVRAKDKYKIKIVSKAKIEHVGSESVKKSYKNLVNVKKIEIASRLHILTDYRLIGKTTKFLYELLFKLIIFESLLYFKVIRRFIHN